ncbi:hypothetical protein L195_g046120, partial [Trifolium pratense]
GCSSRESKKDHPVSSLEIVSVDESEEILDGQSSHPLAGIHSTALVEVNFECHESDCFDKVNKDEYTVGAEVQDKPCSAIEHGLNPDQSLVWSLELIITLLDDQSKDESTDSVEIQHKPCFHCSHSNA